MSFSTSRILLPRASVRPEQLSAIERRLPANWTKSIAVALLMALMGFLLLSPGWAVAEELASGDEGSDGTGIQVASWALTVPYVIGKGAFALGGAVVGGLGYVFSGGNYNTAKAVWTRSIYGTYLIRPAHLRGEEPVHFLGRADESQAEVAPPAKSTSGTPDSTKK
jgi:hypothetical protein